MVPGLRLVFDVGGNQGDYSSELLRQKPGVRVVIFEPAKKNIDRLRSRFSSQAGVKIEPAALGACAGQGVLYANFSGSGIASLYERNLEHMAIKLSHRETVVIRTLDEYLSLTDPDGRLDLLKMDIEGAELDALAGATLLLERTRAVQFEFGGCNLDSRTFFRDFWIFFTKRGFQIHRLTPLGPLHLRDYEERDEAFLTTNYLALNPKRQS